MKKESYVEREREREREIRSSLLMLDLKTDKYDSGKEDEGKTLHVSQVLGMNEDLWDGVCGE